MDLKTADGPPPCVQAEMREPKSTLVTSALTPLPSLPLAAEQEPEVEKGKEDTWEGDEREESALHRFALLDLSSQSVNVFTSKADGSGKRLPGDGKGTGSSTSSVCGLLSVMYVN